MHPKHYVSPVSNFMVIRMLKEYTREENSAIQYWSALARTLASTSAQAGAKEATNFIAFFVVVALPLLLSNHKYTTSRKPRKLKFSMQS